MHRNTMRHQRRGQSLVGILISVFIMIGMAVFFLMPRGGNDGTPGKTVLRRSMDKGEDVVTNSNISQIQQGISMFKEGNEGKPPASLEELRHYLKDYPAEMWENPVDHKPLVYNPATGTICAEGPGCPAPAAAAVANPVAPGANPPAPPQPAPASPTGPGGIHMNIPSPGAGAADAMKE